MWGVGVVRVEGPTMLWQEFVSSILEGAKMWDVGVIRLEGPTVLWLDETQPNC